MALGEGVIAFEESRAVAALAQAQGVGASWMFTEEGRQIIGLTVNKPERGRGGGGGREGGSWPLLVSLSRLKTVLGEETLPKEGGPE